MVAAAALGIALVISRAISPKATDQQAESMEHEVLLELINCTPKERDTSLLIWAWPIRRQRVAYHKHYCWTIQLHLLMSFKKPYESLIFILSTFLTFFNYFFGVWSAALARW